MNKLLPLLLLIFFVTGCISTPKPEKEIVTVYKTEYVKGIKFIPPQRPIPIKELDKDLEIHVITPETIKKQYVESISSSDLSIETKTALLNSLDDITKVAMYNNPFIYIGYSKDEYFISADLLSDILRYIKENNANLEYIESLNLTIIPDESSGNDAN